MKGILLLFFFFFRDVFETRGDTPVPGAVVGTSSVLVMVFKLQSAAQLYLPVMTVDQPRLINGCSRPMSLVFSEFHVRMNIFID